MTTNPGLAMGGFTGKQMKALLGVCHKDKVMRLLNTPFFYDGKLFATDQTICAIYDTSDVPESVISRDKCWSIPSEVVEKSVVKDTFYPSIAGSSDGSPVWVKFKSDLSRLCEDNTEKLTSPAKFLLKLAERDACADYVAPQWFDPKLMSKACALADAFNLCTMRFETVPYGNGSYLLRGKFSGNDKLTIIIMPKKV